MPTQSSSIHSLHANRDPYIFTCEDVQHLVILTCWHINLDCGLSRKQIIFSTCRCVDRCFLKFNKSSSSYNFFESAQQQKLDCLKCWLAFYSKQALPLNFSAVNMGYCASLWLWLMEPHQCDLSAQQSKRVEWGLFVFLPHQCVVTNWSGVGSTQRQILSLGAPSCHSYSSVILSVPHHPLAARPAGSRLRGPGGSARSGAPFSKAHAPSLWRKEKMNSLSEWTHWHHFVCLLKVCCANNCNQLRVTLWVGGHFHCGGGDDECV